MGAKNGVHFILTGGTIDFHWDGSVDTAVPNEHSVIPDFIKGAKLYDETYYTEVFIKDSRQFTEEDRKSVLRTVEESNYLKVIITHGTYTMPDTARYLKANLKRKDQVILFTGAMIPIQGFAPSDGTFNLGFAMAQLQHLKPGIYVCMNGRVFNPEEVVKMIKEGRFASVFTQ